MRRVLSAPASGGVLKFSIHPHGTLPSDEAVFEHPFFNSCLNTIAAEASKSSRQTSKGEVTIHTEDCCTTHATPYYDGVGLASSILGKLCDPRMRCSETEIAGHARNST